MSGLVQAADFDTPVQAHLARTYLESFGLHPVAFDAGIFAVADGNPNRVRLMVIEEELDEALELLEQYRN